MKISFQGSELRAWIMFFVALVLLIMFAIKGSQLGPYWTLMLGSMLGLTIIVTAIQGLMGGKTRDDQDHRSNPDIRKPDSKDEMGGPGIPDFRTYGIYNPSPVQ